MLTYSSVAASEAGYAPAGGAALDQVIGLTIAAFLVTVLLFGVGWAHRTHRIEWFQRSGDWLTRRSGQPGWAAICALFIAGALVVALLGFLWDVSLHAGRGRDEGPLANPAHYLILIGLFALFVGGLASVAWARDGHKPSLASVRITRAWYAPVSGLFITGCGLYALIGFPLDDIWHRLFGQDVTLWGPTHLMLIGGAGLSTAGTVLMHREAQLSDDYHAGTSHTARLQRVTLTISFGAMLIGLSVFQAEFDFGIAQYRMVFAPLMIALAASVTFVAARLYGGPGVAIMAAVFFLVVRGLVSFTVEGVFGQAHHVFPLYLGSAILVELLALSRLKDRPLLFGAVAGLTIGSVGSVIEKFWNDRFFAFAWGPDIWAEGLLMTIPVAIGAGLCGALFAMGLTGTLPRPRIARTVMIGSVLVLAIAVGNGLSYAVPEDARATVRTTEVAGGIEIELTVEPADLVDDDYTWVQLLAWQGGPPGVAIDRLERTGQNTWRSNEPIPVGGNWKTLVRIQDDRTLTAVPVFMPEDPAIGAPEVPVEAEFTREFVPEIELLQRERKLDTPEWLWGVGNLVVVLCSVLMLIGIGVSTSRVSRAIAEEDARRRSDAAGTEARR